MGSGKTPLLRHGAGNGLEVLPPCWSGLLLLAFPMLKTSGILGPWRDKWRDMWRELALH